MPCAADGHEKKRDMSYASSERKMQNAEVKMTRRVILFSLSLGLSLRFAAAGAP
jgi:hypothetical protein